MKALLRREVWTLLRKNMSVGQLLGYVVANIVGLAVILIGVLFYTDSQHSSSEEDNYFSDDYVVLSKHVEGVGFTPLAFSEEDIAELSQQKWVKKIGRFTASEFAVSGSIAIGGRGLSSYLFFEAVPDEFFDRLPQDWNFDPEMGFVPIMLSKDYLTLYNFGFAVPQGLPQVSEDIVGSVSITLRLTGSGNRTEEFEARVVGFSSRLNTIAVPQQFMDWANQRYGDGKHRDPSRLILRIDQRQATDMKRYLAERDIEMAGDNEKKGNVSTFLGVVSGVVAINGLIISLLALFILLLSIFLLLQKSQQTIRRLMHLGFSPSEISRYYELVVLGINSLVTALALTITLYSRGLWSDTLQEIQLGGASLQPMLLLALGYLIVVTLFNVGVIRYKLRSIWRSK